MDQNLLRIVIITTGTFIVVSMLIWNLISNIKNRRGSDLHDKPHHSDDIEQLLGDTDNSPPDPITVASELEQQTPPSTPDLSKIIQFSLIANADTGFTGQNLVESLKLLGLEYGSMKIFEYLNEQGKVDFSVASMVEPGTFPETEIETFSSPGLVFFLQPEKLDDPLAAYDKFIETINILATKLDGTQLDYNRQPLTDQTIQLVKNTLSVHA